MQLERRRAAVAATAITLLLGRMHAALQRHRGDAARREARRLHQKARARLAREVARLRRRSRNQDERLPVTVELIGHRSAQWSALGGQAAKDTLVDNVDDGAGRLSWGRARWRRASSAAAAICGAVNHSHGAQACQRGMPCLRRRARHPGQLLHSTTMHALHCNPFWAAAVRQTTESCAERPRGWPARCSVNSPITKGFNTQDAGNWRR